MLEDNIAAISTAMQPSGVAIIRLSGKSPLDIAEKMFKCKISVKDFEPYRMYVGSIDGGNFQDFGMCVYFKAPNSFTGEDVVEFHCHGGMAITKGILETCLKNGARLAERGEFTRRAFLNGKMSLSSCEGLIDMINSESEAEVKSGYYLYREKLYNKIKDLEEKLTYVLALIDANIDYPEEDIESAELNDVKNNLFNVKNCLLSFANSYAIGNKAKNGVKVVICGKPNAGKSSLLNGILSCEKAIVTDIEGTTRDIVEGNKEINGVTFKFFDTAGIRESEDVIEKIGIDRSKKAIESADVVLFIADGSCAFTEVDEDILKQTEGKNVIKVLNKCDLFDAKTSNSQFDVIVSAQSGYNVKELEKLIYERAGLSSLNFDGDYLVEIRHYEAIKRAIIALDKAIEAMNFMPLDVISIDIRSALMELGLITGETADDNVINEIFSKFCVGK